MFGFIIGVILFVLALLCLAIGIVLTFSSLAAFALVVGFFVALWLLTNIGGKPDHFFPRVPHLPGDEPRMGARGPNDIRSPKGRNSLDGPSIGDLFD